MELKPRTGVIRAALLVAAGIAFFFSSCKPTQPWAYAQSPSTQRPEYVKRDTGRHDLSFDESRGGHTLKRHVGRTDRQLAERLREERNISAASTYTDRDTAESVIAVALQGNQAKITRWLERDRHPNLVLDYDGEHAVGRTLNRGQSQSRPCAHAIVVLHWDGGNEYHVLTSYPECRR